MTTDDDATMLVELTRRTDELTDNTQPWRALVELTPDHKLLHVIRKCTNDELTYIAYYAVTLNRYVFLRWWWSRKSFSLPNDWFNVLLGLFLYSGRVVESDPLQLLLVIYKAAPLRALYQQMLECSCSDCSDCYIRGLMINTATTIPNGTALLFAEWKKYKYQVDKVWMENVYPDHCILPEQLDVFLKKTTITSDWTPLLQICRYGNLKDFKVALKKPKWWTIDNPPTTKKNNIQIYPLVAIALNKNVKVFRYFMETIHTVKKLCALLPALAAERLWDQCHLKELINSDVIIESLKILCNKDNKNWRYKVNMLFWLCDECTEQKLTSVFDKTTIQRLNPRYNHCTFYHFVRTRPIHPNPEDILWIEKQTPLISPKADGVYHYGTLPECQPMVWKNPVIQAEYIKLAWCELYMVFDVNVEGCWDQRVETFAKEHSYWFGPYTDMDAENKDLEILLVSAKEKGWKKIWWPKGVYSNIEGEDFFHLLSKPPTTPYPNDGWVVAGCKGPFWKVKPQADLTLDLLYKNDAWYYRDDRNRYIIYSEVITEFSHTPEPINIPESVITSFIKQALQEVSDETNNNKKIIYMILSLLALNLQYCNKHGSFLQTVRDKIQQCCKSCDYYKRYQWFLQDPLQLPKDWVHEYTGGPIYEGVWRCCWDTIHQKWRPVCRRFDKSSANTVEIEKLLTKQHLHPWNPIDLLKFYNQHPYYNVHTPKTKEIRNLHNKQQTDFTGFTQKLLISTLDFDSYAGGYKPNFCNIYDLDPYIVADRNWYNRKRWFWADATNLKNPVTGEQYHSGNAVAVQNAIHYFAKDQNTWLQFLSTIRNKKKLLITMIDAGRLFKIRDTYTMPDGSTMKRGKQSWHCGVWEGESCLRWNGGKEHREPYLSASFVKRELEADGWNLKSTEDTELCVSFMYWYK